MQSVSLLCDFGSTEEPSRIYFDNWILKRQCLVQHNGFQSFLYSSCSCCHFFEKNSTIMLLKVKILLEMKLKITRNCPKNYKL